jgi:hypothetical protein
MWEAGERSSVHHVVDCRNHGRAVVRAATERSAVVQDIGYGDNGLRTAVDDTRVGRAAPPLPVVINRKCWQRCGHPAHDCVKSLTRLNFVGLLAIPRKTRGARPMMPKTSRAGCRGVQARRIDAVINRKCWQACGQPGHDSDKCLMRLNFVAVLVTTYQPGKVLLARLEPASNTSATAVTPARHAARRSYQQKTCTSLWTAWARRRQVFDAIEFRRRALTPRRAPDDHPRTNASSPLFKLSTPVSIPPTQPQQTTTADRAIGLVAIVRNAQQLTDRAAVSTTAHGAFKQHSSRRSAGSPAPAQS